MTSDIGAFDQAFAVANEHSQLIDRIRRSSGAEYELRLYEKKFQIYPFIKNCNELEKTISDIESKVRGEMFLLGGDEAEMHVFSLEVVRLLFNVVAASSMLVDYSRNFIEKHYSHTSISGLYKELVMTVSEDPLCRFVKGLRNAATHSGNPAQMIMRKRTREGVMTKVLFDGDGLLSRYHNWTARDRKFIRCEMANPEEFSVRRIISEYRTKIENLQQQLDSHLTDFHADDMEELRLLRQEIHLRFPGRYRWPILPINATLPPMEQP
jgi:hypothetical protein